LDNSNSGLSAEKLKTLAAGASISVAALLCFLKAFAALSTGSLSVVTSMIDSLADIFSSAITFVAVKFSNKPLNNKHRYGYGKAESVSALVQAAFIAGSGGFVLYDAIRRLLHPVALQQTTLGIIMMLVCLLITVILIRFQRYVVKQTKSLAISSDSAHYVVDLLTNGSIILSLAVVKFLHWEWFDTLTAVLISFYLIFNAVHIAAEALAEITDKEVDEDIRLNIIGIIKSAPNVLGYHDLRTRISGARMFVEIHLEFDGNFTLNKTHALSDFVEDEIIKNYPSAQVIIHQDPYGLHENRLDHEIDGQCRL
jgi:ferrous-iron efflux pump FieF